MALLSILSFWALRGDYSLVQDCGRASPSIILLVPWGASILLAVSAWILCSLLLAESLSVLFNPRCTIEHRSQLLLGTFLAFLASITPFLLFVLAA